MAVLMQERLHIAFAGHILQMVDIFLLTV